MVFKFLRFELLFKYLIFALKSFIFVIIIIQEIFRTFLSHIPIIPFLFFNINRQRRFSKQFLALFLLIRVLSPSFLFIILLFHILKVVFFRTVFIPTIIVYILLFLLLSRRRSARNN